MSGNTADLYDVASIPALTTTSVPDGQVGVPYPATTLAAAGGAGAPYQIAIVPGTLPPGLAYNAGTLHAVGHADRERACSRPKCASPTSRAIPTSSRCRFASATINVITSPYRLTDAALNHAYSLQLTATGTALTWSFLAGTGNNPLPPGLSLGSNGVISGTPTSIGFYNFEVRAVDATGQAAVKALSINIQNPLVITTTTLPESAAMEANTFCLTAANGVGNRTWSVVTSSPAPGIASAAERMQRRADRRTARSPSPRR